MAYNVLQVLTLSAAVGVINTPFILLSKNVFKNLGNVIIIITNVNVPRQLYFIKGQTDVAFRMTIFHTQATAIVLASMDSPTRHRHTTTIPLPPTPLPSPGPPGRGCVSGR